MLDAEQVGCLGVYIFTLNEKAQYALKVLV